ncbi:MAG: type II toxin-antitoxin system HicA family toxin [Nitrospirota bacterium]
MVKLIEGFQFRLARVSGSHHIFAHPATRRVGQSSGG